MAAPDCPDQDSVLTQLLALLPQGRAWRSTNGGPESGSLMWHFWRAVAKPIATLEGVICQLFDEFFCQTTTQLKAAWFEDYALPDACDPYPDLCAKVVALGGQICADFVTLAAGAGWAIECRPRQLGAVTGCVQTGCAQVGEPSDVVPSIRIRILLAHSPAYRSAGMIGPPKTGVYETGQAVLCRENIAALQCMLMRVLPAHLIIYWEIAHG